MDADKSDGAASNENLPSNLDGNSKTAKLDSQLRELYDAYGKGEMPEDVRKLAEALDREREALSGKRAEKPAPEDDEN